MDIKLHGIQIQNMNAARCNWETAGFVGPWKAVDQVVDDIDHTTVGNDEGIAA